MLTIRASQMQTMAEAIPGRQMVKPCDETKTWVEVRLVDEEGNPVGGQRYKIRLPDSSLVEGVLDDQGTVRFDGILPGECTVSFTTVDEREWDWK
jgi:protocatechuate 3,4-dioxygenase beta subunit